MKTINTNDELKAMIKDRVINFNYEDVEFNCDVDVDAYIINALNINALNINALNINALNINALNINAHNIKAGSIDALDIKARNIEARNIEARNISYYAVCFAYQNITCKSIKGRRENSKHFVLDGEVKIREKKICDKCGQEIK